MKSSRFRGTTTSKKSTLNKNLHKTKSSLVIAPSASKFSTTSSTAQLHAIITSPSSLTSTTSGPFTQSMRSMAIKSKNKGSKFGSAPVPNKKAAKDVNQIQLGLTRRAETALQMVGDITPSAPRNKSVHRISKSEQNVKTKLNQLELFLSHSATNYSLGEILSIYNTFKEVRFAAPTHVWAKMMTFWNTVAKQPSLDETNRQRALKIPVELFDELTNISKLGVYSMMKQKNVHLPEHLLQFNLRPTTHLFSSAMAAMHTAGNHQGVIDLYKAHKEMLNEIPEVQYMPEPIMPEGPEKEQEFVSRRLMAKRRAELQNTGKMDFAALVASGKQRDYELSAVLMDEFMLSRSYPPSKLTMGEYSTNLNNNKQPLANLLLFKEFFQAKVRPIDPTPEDFKRQSHEHLQKLIKKGNVIVDKWQDDTQLDENGEPIIQTGETYRLKGIGRELNPQLPSFLGHVNMKHEISNPVRSNWLELFRSIAQLHPEAETMHLNQKSASGTDETLDTTTTALTVVTGKHNTGRNSALSRFLYLHDMKGLIQNKALRRNMYKIAREEYGITIDKSFFLPMVQESNSYDEVLAWLDDFHEQVSTFQQKAKDSPWNEEELAAQEKEKKIKQMLVVNLNVAGHDERMRKVFGRYFDEVKGIGYDDEFYTAVHTRLVNFLVESYQQDDENNELLTSTGDNIDVDELYDIETVVSPDGTMNKVRKLKVGADGNILTLRTGKKQSLYDIFKKSKQGGDGQSAGTSSTPQTDAVDDEGEEEEVSVSNADGTISMKKVKKVHKSAQQQSSDSSNPLFDANPFAISTLPPPLTKNQMVQVVDRFNKETTDMLLSSTSRQKVKHILESIQTVRVYQEVYGLPVAAKTESKYLEALILMSRRNEIYPPVLATSDTSLIRFDVAPYIPSFDGEKPSHTDTGENDPNLKTPLGQLSKHSSQKPLVTFKDRLNYIHKSIRRREDQLKLTLQEVEHSIDALATMKNETDEYGRLKKINIKVLNDAIESLSELAVDASILRGPFDHGNIFHYSGSKAHEVLGKLSRGEQVDGMRIDKASGAKYVPGITEPHPHQIDRVDLDEFTKTARRINTYAFGEMKHALQIMIQLSTGMTPQQTQHIPLLQSDPFGSMVTESTYIPLLKACAAHGDYQNVLLLIESAHQHRDVVPTTNMLNFVAIAFMNSDKPRHAAGVLDIMETASKPENRKVRHVSEEELSRAITHGTADALLELVQSQLDLKVVPNAETISLLLRMYKSQGMLDHVEELWRRLTYHEPTSWTSFSAVEEQKMVAQVLAAELDSSTSQNHPLFDQLAGHHKGSLQEMPNLSMAIEDAYDKALNPIQNKALAAALKHDDIRTNMKALLYNRQIESNLPHGAHRADIPKGHMFNELRLDSTSITVMLQTFIQLGHPMHALQLYLDLRQSMPLFPITPPKHTKAFTKARDINRFRALQQNNDPDHDNSLDSLTDFMVKTQGQQAVDQALKKNADGFDHTADAMMGLMAVPITPSKRSFVTDKALMVTTAGTNGTIQTDAMGVKIEAQTTINLSALSPKMVQIGHISAQNTYKTTNPSENSLVNSSTYEQLMAGTSRTKKDSPFEQIRNGKWPEVDAIASLALYTYKKGEQYLKKMSSDGKSVANIPPEVLAHAQLLVDSSQRVLSKLKRYTVDTPYLPGDESTLLYYSSPGTLNNVTSPNAGIELTQPRLLLPFTTETVDIFREIDTLMYSDIALEETVFKIRYQTIKPIGMQRWFTIFPTMINQCKGITQSEQSRVDISGQLDALRDDVEMLLATGRRKPKYVRIAEIIEEKRLTGAPLTGEETKLIESHQSVARTDSDQSNLLQPGRLHNQTNSQDRGISHPKTDKFIDSALPAVGNFDLSEFTAKDDASKAWVSNFKTFFNSKASTSEFLSKISAAPVLDDAKKAEMKAKLLGQTKKAFVPIKADDNDDEGIIPADDGLIAATSDPSIDANAPLPLISTPSTRPSNTPLKKFDRWVDPNDPKPVEYAQLATVPSETVPSTGELPTFPFMTDKEKKTDSKKLIAQIQAELRDAHNGIGLYPGSRGKGGRTPLVGPDGKIKTEFLIEDGNQTGGQIWDKEAELDAEVAVSTQAAIERGLVPADASFQKAIRKMQQFDVMEGTLKQPKTAEKKQNSLLLPEVQQMKAHLGKQAAAQRAIMDQYIEEQQTGENKLGAESQVTISGYSNKLQQMMSADLTLLKPFQQGKVDNLATDSQPAQWLTNPTDISVATQVTTRHVKMTKDRFKPLPGIIDEEIHGLNQRSEFMKKVAGDDGVQAKPITPVRPGGIHTSPHGPQSFRPENQFRSPSSMAKLANVSPEDVDETKYALDDEERRIKFKVATHGVATSDRPGRPTKISQEYLEKYLMGIGPDPKDKRSQARHSQLEEEFAQSRMDSSFIQMGDPNARITNRGGGIQADGTQAGTHGEGYGVGVHKFRERNKAKLTEIAVSGARRLLEEFEAETFAPANDSNPFGDGNDLEGNKHKIPKKERESLEYQDLFTLGGDDDAVGSAAMSRTGHYDMLSSTDKQSRDDAIKKEGFADLQAQMDALLAPRQGQTTAINRSLGNDQFDFTSNKQVQQSKRIKEVFSSATMHSNQKDYFGVGNKGGKKRDNQSTLFD